MVRKSPRTSAKSTEKKSETSRRSGTRASTRKKVPLSDDSDNEVLSKTLSKIRSPSRSEKNSSEYEGSSDKDSKKPLKKRVRGRNRASSSSSSSTLKTDKKEDEVTEDRKSKGKSKGKHKSYNDAVINQDIENENAHTQVTNVSPQQNDDNDDESKSEQKVVEIVENATSAAAVAAVEEIRQDDLNGTADNNEPNISINANVSAEICQQQKNKEKTDNIIISSENVEIETNKVEESPISQHCVEPDYANVQPDNAQNIQQTEEIQSIKLPEIVDKSNEIIAQESEVAPAEHQQVSVEEETIENNVKQPNDKANEIIEQEAEVPLTPSPPLPQQHNPLYPEKEKTGNYKKILLKRPLSVATISEESKNEKVEQADGEWNSSYESNKMVVDIPKKITENEEDKHKKISLKRQISEEKKENLDSRRRRSSREDKHKFSPDRSTGSDTLKEKKRRRSSAYEEETKEYERTHSKLPKKPSKPVKLNRSFNQDSQAFTPPLPPPSLASIEDPQKTCKWDKAKILCDDSDSLVTLNVVKDVCPNIQFVTEQEVDLEIKERKMSEKERHKSFNEMEAEEMEKIEAELNAEPEKVTRDNIIATNRKISIVDDMASKLKPPPSPAQKPVSEILFITNLVRPFTVKQLKELLERTGKIRLDGFWTDRIKSKCYVHYETAEEAESTRNALHGVHWPIGNGKKLIIDYGTVEDMENAKNPPPPPPPQPVTATPPTELVMKDKPFLEKENQKPDYVDGLGPRKAAEEDASLSLRPTTVRDWDIGKMENRGRRSRSRSRHNKRVARKSHTPEELNNKKKRREEPVQQKAMDDLFLKTKATPSVYWQPLSPEEIALKQQQRQARLEENKRRMEELRSSGRSGGGGGIGSGSVVGSSSRDPQRERDRSGRDRNFRRR